MTLLTWANLAYYQQRMMGLRRAIAERRLADFTRSTRCVWQQE